MKSITVLLADDHTIVREGLESILRFEKDIKVVALASDGRTAVELALETHPDVVVMDIAMANLNGLEASRQLRSLLPECKILILSAHGDDSYVEQAIQFGVAGYLLKQASAHSLGEAVRAVHEGKTYFSPLISARLSRRRQASNSLHGSGSSKSPPILTSRETEVLQLIAEGKANKQTAAELQISTKTVEKHRQNLKKKLDIHDTAGLTRYAISAGLIENDIQITIL